jgi:hypothetical protein
MPLIVDGENCLPVVVCDYCLRPIPKADDGNYQWRMAYNDTDFDGSRIYFTHKACCHAFEQSHPPASDWGAMGLDVLPIYLGDSLALNWKAARRLADYFAGG